MLKKILLSFRELFEFPIIYLPGGLGRKIRYLYYKNKFKSCGKNVWIDEGVIIENPKSISIGDNTWIDKFVVLRTGKVSEYDWIKEKKLSPDFKYKMKKIENPNFKYQEGELVIGNNCHIASFSVIKAYGGVFIGDDTTVAAGVKIFSTVNHYSNLIDPSDKKIYKASHMSAPENIFPIMGPVVLESNVCIGLNTVILPGSVIRKNTWIGSNSTVIGEIGGNCVAVGNPCKKIKDI